MSRCSVAHEIRSWTTPLEACLDGWMEGHGQKDPAHDAAHVRRVVRLAMRLAKEKGADPLTVLAAAYMHDIANFPKDDPRRKTASTISANRAVDILDNLWFPKELLDGVRHAIEAHSFSAGIEPLTIEAKCVRDADRIDALGAIGIARWGVVSGLLGRTIVDRDDPLALTRPVDDSAYGLDHFPAKLFKLPDTMSTETGRRIANERVAFMEEFRNRLAEEVEFGEIARRTA